MNSILGKWIKKRNKSDFVVLILLAIPQLQYRKHPDTYFLITEDYDEYLEKMKEKEAQKA